MTKKQRSRLALSGQGEGHILLGARVRAADGFIGTVERLLSPAQSRRGAQSGDRQEFMIVRSDDGAWRFQLPTQVITRITNDADGQIVHIGLAPEELAPFASQYPRAAALRNRGQRSPARQAHSVAGENDDTVLRIPVAQEELFVEKRPVVRGTVRVHASVETKQQNLTVPAMHEEAIIEHVPADEYTSAAAANPEDILIPLFEERLVVEKRVVVKEYVRIRKRRVSTQHEITGAVRNEIAHITEEPAAGAYANDAPLISRSRRR